LNNASLEAKSALSSNQAWLSPLNRLTLPAPVGAASKTCQRIGAKPAAASASGKINPGRRHGARKAHSIQDAGATKKRDPARAARIQSQ